MCQTGYFTVASPSATTAEPSLRVCERGCAVLEQYEYTVQTPLLTANAQRRLHFHVWADICREARQSSYILAKQAKIPRCLKVRLAFFPGQAKGRLADPGAHFPIAKAVEDGLVDAKVIPDDSGLYVERLCMYAPERTKVDQLRVVLVPLEM